MPLPRTRKVRPFGVPAGIFTVTGAPRCDGTLMSAPSAASGTVTGTETVRLPPDRPNTGWGVTCTRTYRSPAGPPRSPGAPLPRSLIRWPSATPAGIRAWMVRVLAAWPLPLHEVHGSSTTSPRPRQVLHGSEKAKLPRFRLDCPGPSQVGQTLGTVPALAPVPWQTGQGPSPVSLSGTVVPSTESLNDKVVSVSTSAPRRGRVWVPARPPPPNMPPRMSPSPPLPGVPPPAWPPPKRSPRSNPNPPPGWPGRPVPGPAAEHRARVVVLLALLLVGQDVVGLGNLLEAFLGVTVALVGVRVVLTSQLSVRRLDLVSLRGLRDAQDLVIVLFQIIFGAHLVCSSLPSPLIFTCLPGPAAPSRRSPRLHLGRSTARPPRPARVARSGRRPCSPAGRSPPA